MKKFSPATYAGAAAGVLMIAFFLLSRLMGWSYIWPLHYINILFLIPAIYYVIFRLNKRSIPYPYLQGLGAGLGVCVKGGFLFSFFLVLYLNFFDPHYMHKVRESTPLGHYMTPLLVALVYLTEMVCAGFIVTLIILQLFKSRSGTQ